MSILVNDLSVLTNVPKKVLNKFESLSNYCIGHAVHEAACKQQDIADIDLGIGVLSIKFDDKQVRYRFVPSKELDKLVSQTIVSKTSPILTQLENDLQEKIEQAYKELL